MRSEQIGDAAKTFALRVQTADVGRYGIMFRTPFSGAIPAPSFADFETAALWQGQGKENLSYGLDVHESHEEAGRPRVRKLMSLEWGHNSEVALVSFYKGDWDASFLEVLK